jgi:hypothetical protein
MKKTFLKSMVATAIVGVTVALGSVVAFAAESWSADSLTATSSIKDTSIKLSDNFTYAPLFDSSNNAKSKVTSNSKDFTDGAAFAQRLQVGGKSSLSKGTGVFTFTAPTAGTLTIYAVTGSNGEARTVELYNASGTELKTWTSGPVEDGYEYEPFTYTVEAGTYTIAGSSGAVNFYGMSFVSDSDKIADTVAKAASDYYAIDTVKATYIIHAVTADELKYSSLALKGKDDAEGNPVNVAATTEVYKSIEFADGSVLNASDIGADAIYAVKVTGAAGAAPTASFTWVDAK